jgi:flavorubredoxin
LETAIFRTITGGIIMTSVEMKPGIFPVGAADWGRRLFDGLIPLPDGTSYNSYLVKGSLKTALVDTVDPTMKDVLLNRLDELQITKLDYIVTNHAEQDHSGSLPLILDRYPGAQAVCTPKCKTLLMEMLLIPEKRITTVADRECLPLGDRTLEFIYFPWVHWPETMLTYSREDKILFSCDLFGSHIAASELYVTDEARVYEAAKRYFAEIMMPFRTNIRDYIARLGELAIDMIAPSHGPVHDKPEFILAAYRRWIADVPNNLVVLPFVSMHGSTRRMVDYLVESLAQRKVPVEEFDLAVTDIGKLASALVDAATVVIGTPTVLSAAHPLAAHAVFLFNALRPKTKFVSIIGSYGWGGRTVEQLGGMITSLKPEILPPVLSRGFPKAADFDALKVLADTIAEKHKSLPEMPCLTVT